MDPHGEVKFHPSKDKFFPQLKTPHQHLLHRFHLP